VLPHDAFNSGGMAYATNACRISQCSEIVAAPHNTTWLTSCKRRTGICLVLLCFSVSLRIYSAILSISRKKVNYKSDVFMKMGFWKRLTEFLWGSDFYFQKIIQSHPVNTLDSGPVLDVFDVNSVDGSCNSANNRQCWSRGFDINTDYEIYKPNGVVRKVSNQ